MVEWDELFMSMVYLIAMKSKDQSSHLGAVIVDDRNIVQGLGYNGLPRGVNDNVPERQLRPEKYYWFEHAERNAIFNSNNLNLRNCRMYTQGIPCCDCARAIIQNGITEVIIHKQWDGPGNSAIDMWAEHAKRSQIMFDESGVTVRIYNGPILKLTGMKYGSLLEL